MRVWLGIFACLLSYAVVAQGLTPEQEQSYNRLLYETRCVTCLNQNLTDSNAPVAKAMREEIYRQLEKGHSEEEIRAFLIERYGEFVTFRPVFSQKTYMLWFLPILIGLFSILALKKMMRPKNI